MSTRSAEAHLGATFRRDRWWLAPLLTAIGLIAVGVYAAVVGIMGSGYR